jgi:hypothetical protein
VSRDDLSHEQGRFLTEAGLCKAFGCYVLSDVAELLQRHICQDTQWHLILVRATNPEPAVGLSGVVLGLFNDDALFFKRGMAFPIDTDELVEACYDLVEKAEDSVADSI